METEIGSGLVFPFSSSSKALGEKKTLRKYTNEGRKTEEAGETPMRGGGGGGGGGRAKAYLAWRIRQSKSKQDSTNIFTHTKDIWKLPLNAGKTQCLPEKHGESFPP